MKKLFAMVLMGVMVVSTGMAQPKSSDKGLWKSAKKMAQTLTKEGWKIDGSRSLEDMLYFHYQKLNDENNQELIANVIGNTSVKTMNQAQQWAQINASTTYAKQAKMMVVGRITNETGAGIEGAPSVDNFYEGYESQVVTEIKGELKKSFAVYREKDGGFDYRVFYLINEASASQARIRAMQRAMMESEFARANAERISEFVRNGFTIENE